MAVPSTSQTVLLTGVRALLTCDSGEVVKGILEFVLSQRRWVSPLRRALHGTENAPLATVLMLVNALRCYTGISTAGHGDAIVAARRPNERRAVAELMRMLPDRRWTEVVFRWRLVTVAAALARLAPTIVRRRRTARLARRARWRSGVLPRSGCWSSSCTTGYTSSSCEPPSSARGHVEPQQSARHRAEPGGASCRRAGRPYHARHARVADRAAGFDVAIVECEASRLVYANAGCRWVQS
jgi:hypothetical protein